MAEEPDKKPARRTERIDKYEILELIATGGMGIVYKARDVTLGRLVALKLLAPDVAKNSTMVERFQREARAAALLRHENIVAIYDVGKSVNESNGNVTHFIALEYIEGIDLQDYINSHKCQLDPKEARKIVIQAARALDHAHQNHIVHRDIKPSNFLLMTTQNPMLVKLTDFGLAINKDDEESRLTRVQSTVGTVDYMSPEQARDSRSADIRSDIYSLGCTFYHMLAGEAPFAKGTLPERIIQHMNAPPPDVRERNKHVPKSFAAIINRMLAKKPGDRYQTPAELLQDLEHPDRVVRPDKPAAKLERNTSKPSGDVTSVIEKKEYDEEKDEPKAVEPARPLKKKRRTDDAIVPATAIKRRADTDEAEKPKKRSAPATPWWLYGVGGSVALLVVMVVYAIFQQVRTPPVKKKIEPPPVVAIQKPIEAFPEEVIDTSPAKMGVAPLELPLMDPSFAKTDRAQMLKQSLGPFRAFPNIPADAKVLQLARVGPVGPASVRTLPEALAQAQADQWTVIEIADNGPIFVPALAPLSRRSIVLRGAAGYHPLLVWERPRKAAEGKAPLTMLSLSQGTLVLANLDVVMRATGDGPAALFDLPETDFFARDCTFSLAGKTPQNTTVLRRHGSAELSPENPLTQTWLQRCYVRGPQATLLDLRGASTNLLLEESLIAGQQQPLIHVQARAEDSLVLFCVRSTLIAGQTLLRWQPLDGKRSNPQVHVRTLDSILSCDDATASSGAMLHLTDDDGLTKTSWGAMNCVYAGWKRLLSSNGKNIANPDVAAWRAQWGYSSGDQAVADCWPASPPSSLEEQPASTFMPLAAIVAYEALTGPGAAGCVIGRLPGEPESWVERVFEPRAAPAVPLVTPSELALPPIAVANDGLYRGEQLNLNKVDLGKHLTGILQSRQAAPRVVMHLFGKGSCPTSPLRIKGVQHLVLYFVPTPNPKDTLTLEVNPVGVAQRSPLIEMTGGHLELIGARIRLSPITLVPTALHVQEGDVTITRCRLEGPLAKSSEAFKSLLTLSNSGESPTTLLIRDSILISSKTLIQLRDRVQLQARNNVLVTFADAVRIDTESPALSTTHVLEHNTWAVRHAIIALRAAPDFEAQGMVGMSARYNAFLRPFTEDADKSVLLRGADPWIVRGHWNWQGRYNVYDTRLIAYFASSEKQAGKQTLKDWQSVWGPFSEQDSLLLDVGAAGKTITLDNVLQLDRLALPPQLRGDPGQPPPGANLLGLGLLLKKKG